MKYPRIPRDERASVKIKTTEYNKINHLQLTGSTMLEIAELYNVSDNCIRSILNPGYKKRQAINRNEWTKRQWKKDPLFRKRSARQRYELTITRMMSDPKYYQWVIVSKREGYEKAKIRAGK